MGRPPYCDKFNMKRGAWTAEEDAKLLAYTSTHGTGNWTSVPKKAGLKRCGKSCRLRWTNYLRPNLKHESFTTEEEEMIISLHATLGSRWSIIANQLPGRTDNDVKNHWNTKLRKKMLKRGIDPVTHKPISHLLQSIRGLTSEATVTSRTGCRSLHISSLNRDLKNVFLSKPGPSITPSLYAPNATWDAFPQLHNTVTPSSTAATDASSSFPAHFWPNEVSSSSSSSTAATAHQQDVQTTGRLPASDLQWSDFLIEDIFLSRVEEGSSAATSLENTENCNEVMPLPLSKPEYGAMDHHCYAGHECYGLTDWDVSDVFGVSSETSSSFIDALLDHDREMQSKFPEFLGDLFSFL